MVKVTSKQNLAFPDTNVLYDLINALNNTKTSGRVSIANFKKSQQLINLILNKKIKLIISPIVLNELIRISGFCDLIKIKKNNNNVHEQNYRALKQTLKILTNKLKDNFEIIAMENISQNTESYNLKDNVGELAFKYIQGLNKAASKEINDLILYATASNLGIPFITEDKMFHSANISNILKSINIKESNNSKYATTKNLDTNSNRTLDSTIYNMEQAIYSIGTKGNLIANNRFHTLNSANLLKTHKVEDISSPEQINSVQYFRKLIVEKEISCDEIYEIIKNNKSAMNCFHEATNNDDKTLITLLNQSLYTRIDNYKNALKLIKNLVNYEANNKKYQPSDMIDNELNFEIIRKENIINGFQLNGVKYQINKNNKNNADLKQKLDISFDMDNITIDNFLIYLFYANNDKFKNNRFYENALNADNADLHKFLNSTSPSLETLLEIVNDPISIDNLIDVDKDKALAYKNKLYNENLYMNSIITNTPAMKEQLYK